MNRPIYILKIESVINNVPKQEAPGPSVFTGEFYQISKKEIIPILYHLLPKIEAQRMLPSSFCQASITLITKWDKTLHENKTKQNYRPISLVNIDANIFDKVLACQMQWCIKWIICHDQMQFIPVVHDWFTIPKSNNVIHHNRLKKKKTQDHINVCRKYICQNSTSIHIENVQ